MIAFPPKIFVTGTGTDVGKTIASGILMSGLDSAYWKPIQSGRPTDTSFLKETTGLPSDRFLPERYLFSNPVSPHLAARLEETTIDLEDINQPEHPYKYTVIEGAGGILVPINDRFFIVDLIKKLDCPVLVVAHSTLGTINHTLLTLKELRARSIEIFGVFLNGPKNKENKDAIEKFGGVQVIAECENLGQVTAQNLRTAFERSFCK